jgi:tetratricopeptide (TPR) repeat protein
MSWRAQAVAALVVLVAMPALADRRPPELPLAPIAPDTPEYQSCLRLADTVPEEAFERALRWQTDGGGFPARHCAALALITLQQYAEAADRLERLAEDMSKARDRTSLAVLGQAGNAWMLAGMLERAKFVFDAALKIAPDDADLLVDRARARGENGEFQAALADLDRALKLAPLRDDALVYRAAARRKLNQPERATEDLAAVLSRQPNHLEALLERGAVRRALADLAGARADWTRVVLLAPDSPAAEAAQSFIEQLDVKR